MCHDWRYFSGNSLLSCFFIWFRCLHIPLCGAFNRSLGPGAGEISGFYNESVNDFFLECPLYSAPRTNLLSSAARIFADRWSSMTKVQIVSVFLFGSKLLSPKQNSDLFFHVQSFISDSKRFYKRT